MHFLNKLVETPKLDNPANNHRDVHRHFYRYSKGEFIGPAVKITQTASRINLKGSFEYEDIIQEVILRTISENEVNIKGVLITGADINNIITNLGLEWKLIKSKGQTENYKATFAETVSKNILLDAIQTFRDSSYLLFSLNLNPSSKVTTKIKIPQPSKKKMEDDEVEKRIQFSTGVINNTENNLKLILENFVPDFISEIPKKWKSILVKNNYRIEDIELPKSITDSKLLRIMAIRKGILIRSVEIDGDLIEKQYSVIV